MASNIGKIIAGHIANRNMTVHAFAIQYGINPATLTKIINGNSNPLYETVCEIADALGITIGELEGEGKIEGNFTKEQKEIIKNIKDLDVTQCIKLLGYIDCLKEKG